MQRTRRRVSADFQAKVGLEELQEQMTIQELSSKFEVHPNQISTWKSEFLNNASIVFEGKSTKAEEADTDKLYKIIGNQKVEMDCLKTVLGK